MPVSKKLPPLPDQHGYVIEGSRFSFLWYQFFVALMAALREIKEVADISDWETPIAVTTATHTVDTYEKDIVCNHAGTVTLTLPDVAANFGRVLHVKTITANAVVSSAANVTPLAGGAVGTAMLPATDGAWGRFVSNGTAWIKMAGS